MVTPIGALQDDLGGRAGQIVSCSPPYVLYLDGLDLRNCALVNETIRS
jgi:hypothetical protein